MIFFFQVFQLVVSVLQLGVERLRKLYVEINNKNDFYLELLNVRQKWRLKKIGILILGDFSYRLGLFLFVNFLRNLIEYYIDFSNVFMIGVGLYNVRFFVIIILIWCLQ